MTVMAIFGGVDVTGAVGGGRSNRVGVVNRVGMGRRLEQDHSGPADAGSALAVDRLQAEPKVAVGVDHIERDDGDTGGWVVGRAVDGDQRERRPESWAPRVTVGPWRSTTRSSRTTCPGLIWTACGPV